MNSPEERPVPGANGNGPEDSELAADAATISAKLKPDQRRFFIPPWLDECNLRPVPFRVYCHLLRRAGENGECFTKGESIAKACRIHRDSVWPALKEIMAAGLMKEPRKRFGGCNQYTLTPPTNGNGGVIDTPPISGNGGVIDTPPISGNGGVIDCHQLAEKEGFQLAEKEGFQLAEKEGFKEIPSKKTKVRNPIIETLVETVWRSTPPIGRERSSKKQLREALQKLSAEDHSKILPALERWKRSQKWMKDGGQYVEGIHRWISNRQFENLPDEVPKLITINTGGRKPNFGLMHEIYPETKPRRPIDTGGRKASTELMEKLYPQTKPQP